MDISKPKYTKTLKEHLQQRQEPFSLQNFIMERTYMFKNCSNSDSSNVHSLYSSKNLKWSIKYDHMHKIRKGILHAKGTLRSILYKFSTRDEEQNSEDQYYVVHEVFAGSTQQTDEIFSVERLAASDYFSDSNVEGNVVLPYKQHHSSTLVNMFQAFTLTRSLEVDTGFKPYWISPEEPLPNAVCHLRSPEVAPLTSLGALSHKVVGDTVFSTYLRKLLVNSSNILKLGRPKKEKLDDMARTISPCRSRIRNRRVLQKRGQLSFECIERSRKFHLNEGKSLSIKANSSKSEEDIGSVIQERFSFLEKQCRQVRKMAHMLYKESSVTSQEWKNLQIVNRDEILMEMGDDILNDIIVTEITDSF